MKIFLFGVLFLLSCTLLQAQRLYVNDMFHGSYRSYNVGDAIELVLLDSSKSMHGRITRLDQDRLYLSKENDTSVSMIMLNQVAGIIVRKNPISIGRIIGFGASYFMVITGGVYVLVGVLLLKVEPTAGLIALGFGGVMVTGGALILKGLTKKGGLIRQTTIDNVNHRIFVE